MPTVIVYATLGIATTVLLEATLSFLGRGVQPPTPAWGMMIFESQSYFLNAPWLVFIPGAAILIRGPFLQPRRRRPARCARPDAAGAQLMLRYLARRLAASLFILLGVSVVTFGLTFMIPADPVAMIAGRNSTAETARADPPSARPRSPAAGAICQLMSAASSRAISASPMPARADVGDLIASRLPATLLLMLGAIVAELLIGIPGRHLRGQPTRPKLPTRWR